MVKTNSLGVRVDPDVKAALERAAKADDRSISNLVERILREWVTKNGFLALTPTTQSARPAAKAPARAAARKRRG
jgi:hypothetical protein